MKGATMTRGEIRAEIQWLTDAIQISNSPYLKRDYTKRIERLRKLLR